MKSKFLGIVCFSYCFIIIWIITNGYLNNYLAPNMHKYIYISFILLLVIGFVFIFSKKKSKIYLSDIFLLIPLIIIFVASDGKLSTDFAINRSNSFSKIKEKKVVKRKEVSKVIDMDLYKDIDFSSVDFSVVDESYAGLSDAIVYNSNPEKLVGKTIKLKGFIMKESSFLPKDYFAIGKYMISCCAADSSFGGFMARSNDMSKLKNNKWYEIYGVLNVGVDTYNQKIAIIDVVKYKKIDGKDEELYMYPCYAYGDGSCSEVVKYNLS